jgi:retron-type reverse transcriptase
MPRSASFELTRPFQWSDVYSEAELYKAALRVYTKPLFHWRKALSTSVDGRTLYDFAGRGLRSLDTIHQALQRKTFRFRPAIALHYNFNGKHRTLYLAPWEERIVDLLLYRVLNHKLHGWFSPNCYAYREGNFGLDLCQTRIAAVLRAKRPLYVIKRDIADYFATVNHDVLLGKLAELVDPGDYLFRLLEQRARFLYAEDGQTQQAALGIPFGTAIACLFANVYLTDLDREIESVAGVSYFRYADDILLLSQDREAARKAAEVLEGSLSGLRLSMKASRGADLLLACGSPRDSVFTPAAEFRHLGLLFRAGGSVALSRDKLRKVRNLFSFAFRRGCRRWKKVADPMARAQLLVTIAAETIDQGLRNVAILDYYLKHVDDEDQLRILDRWLAEEILSLVFGGHKKSHFRRISFGQLREMGLPSLLHRRRLILRGQIESPFFIWQRQKGTRAFRGTVARLPRSKGVAAFSRIPEAAAVKRP